jgi:hypothetical protein
MPYKKIIPSDIFIIIAYTILTVIFIVVPPLNNTWIRTMKGRPGRDRENCPQFRAEYRRGTAPGPGPQLHTMGNKVDTYTCHTGNIYTDHVCDNNIQALRTA